MMVKIKPVILQNADIKRDDVVVIIKYFHARLLNAPDKKIVIIVQRAPVLSIIAYDFTLLF